MYTNVYVHVLGSVQTALRYLRVLLSDITEHIEIIILMNVDTSAVMRVVIENFNMTASEMARVWAQQDEYIDLLESQLKQSEDKGRKKWSQREQMQTKEVIRKKQEVQELKALIAKLKASLAWSPDSWTALQSHGGLKGASEQTLSELKLMDRAFNLIHGVGPQLNTEMKENPIQTTVSEIRKRCPEIKLLR